MAKYRFPLQALLEHRSRIERDRQISVARAERDRVLAEDEVRGRQRAIVSIKGDLRDALSPGKGPIDLRHARLQANASLHASIKTQQSALKLAGTLRRLASERERLVDSARERRVLELLKERRIEAWNAEQRRRETAELDDLTNARAARPDDGGRN